jgi:sulfhydrogenase subunit alpha
VQVPVLARVEGEGALDLVVSDGRIEDIRLRIYEPPRLFEQLLVGRDHARDPGPGGAHLRDLPGGLSDERRPGRRAPVRLRPGPWVRRMRRLFYCGEWIQSHALHIHLLAAPDFLGFESAPAMAASYPRGGGAAGYALQALGNRIIRCSARARCIRWGPESGDSGRRRAARCRRAPAEIAEALTQTPRNWSLDCVPAAAGEPAAVHLRLPAAPDEYPMIADRIVSRTGLDISVDTSSSFEERQVPHSTALHGLHRGLPYLVGPLARMNLNPTASIRGCSMRSGRTGVRFPSHNMYHSIVARSAEILQALLRPSRSSPTTRRPTGLRRARAPRGHRLRGERGPPRSALAPLRSRPEGAFRPPASCRLPARTRPRIEEDLRLSLTASGLDQAEETLRQPARW